MAGAFGLFQTAPHGTVSPDPSPFRPIADASPVEGPNGLLTTLG